jgi:tetratricopeptide (TPR) repeat protein
VSGAQVELLGLLGRGGMGAVYEARVRGDPRRFAAKVLTCSSDHLRARFQREGELAARLRHPHVVAVHSAGQLPDGTDYLLFELVEGTPLDRLLDQRGTLPAADALRWGIQLADALAAAHAEGIVHRDVKPANVLIDAQGDARLADFGIALALDQERLSRTGQWAGTLAYMAPEQLGTGEIGPWTDVRALGALLFHALSGRLPFEEQGAVLAARLMASDPCSLGTRCPQLDPQLVAVIDRCLARRRAERYQDAVALRADLEAVVARRPIAARPRPGVLSLVAARARWLLPVTCALLLLGLGLAISRAGGPVTVADPVDSGEPAQGLEDPPPALFDELLTAASAELALGRVSAAQAGLQEHLPGLAGEASSGQLADLRALRSELRAWVEEHLRERRKDVQLDHLRSALSLARAIDEALGLDRPGQEEAGRVLGACLELLGERQYTSPPAEDLVVLRELLVAVADSGARPDRAGVAELVDRLTEVHAVSVSAAEVWRIYAAAVRLDLTLEPVHVSLDAPLPRFSDSAAERFVLLIARRVRGEGLGNLRFEEFRGPDSGLGPRCQARALLFYGGTLRPEEAVSVLREAEALDPGCPWVHLTLSNALYSLGQRDRALVEVRQALDATPERLRSSSRLVTGFQAEDICQSAVELLLALERLGEATSCVEWYAGQTYANPGLVDELREQIASYEREQR